MSRSRYEPIPQTTDEEVIDLHTIIPQPPGYNYNSGVPNSPPPSFRSSQSVQSVQLQPDRSANATPVPSFPAPNPSDPATHSQIQDLQFRIERLEESIGRLLLEKEVLLTDGQPESSRGRNNCCVTFSTDDDAEAMRSMITGSRDNCCVRYEGRNKGDAKRRQIETIGLIFGIILLTIGIFTVVIISIDAHRPEKNQRG